MLRNRNFKIHNIPHVIRSEAEITAKAKPFSGTGDRGDTATAAGRVPKDSKIVEVLGSIDELVSFIGLARSMLSGHNDVDKILENIQRKLFVYAAVLHGMPGHEITQEDVDWVEKITVDIDSKLPPLKRFILPSGSQASAAVHVARTVCRRAERSVVALSKEKTLPPSALPFINRLSSLLFVLARYINYKDMHQEEYV
ncbi:MAG: cob(I)yrinic acid a,c-diamide adenosyltransferase [Conexivisphaerales archaeon]